eukprot:7337407-Prymnesium_polylepis.1
MNPTVPKHMLRSTQYALDARVYDEDAIPPAVGSTPFRHRPLQTPCPLSPWCPLPRPTMRAYRSLAAKRGVLEAKRPDVIGVGKPSWNGSTVSENMARFPDRAMMRQLAVVRPGGLRPEHLGARRAAARVPPSEPLERAAAHIS